MRREWIERAGPLMPVAVGVLVDVRYRNGDVYEAQPAGVEGSGAEDWSLTGDPFDIVAYRAAASAEWRLLAAATNLLAKFGGDTPDWLRSEAGELERAAAALRAELE